MVKYDYKALASVMEIVGHLQEKVEKLEETIVESEEQSFPVVTALALVSLLAVWVISALVTLYQRRSNGNNKERKIHRNASPINMNFAHEGSLRRTRQNIRHDYEEVTTLSGRVHHLPGGRIGL